MSDWEADVKSNVYPRSFRTMAVHGLEAERVKDAVTTPIFQSSTYLLGEPESFDDIRYTRLNNTPNQVAVAKKLAALEGADAAVVTPSGTSAIASALVSFLDSGDRILVPTRIYGGTRKVLSRLEALQGIQVDVIDLDDPATWDSRVTDRTRILYVEPMSNPLLRVAPMDKLIEFAKAHDLLTVADNTLLSPINYRPLSHGADLVVHSASKYLNGHADVVAGVVAGSKAHVERVRRTLNVLGICPDPNACFLLDRGLKTLPLRVAAHNETAQRLAEALERIPTVAKVYYPGLLSSRDFERARGLFRGFGGLLTFEVDGEEQAEQVISRLQYASRAPSLGGAETLVSRPVCTSHAGLSPAVQSEMGVHPNMVRVAVGLEDPGDLIADFEQAISSCSPACWAREGEG